MPNDLQAKGECVGNRREMSPPWFSSKLDDDPAELVCNQFLALKVELSKHYLTYGILKGCADFAGCHPIAFAILMSSMYLPSQYTPFGVLPISLNPSFL